MQQDFENEYPGLSGPNSARGVQTHFQRGGERVAGVVEVRVEVTVVAGTLLIHNRHQVEGEEYYSVSTITLVESTRYGTHGH